MDIIYHYYGARVKALRFFEYKKEWKWSDNDNAYLPEWAIPLIKESVGSLYH
ncbi:7982_t:CDS:2 [Entrophospora sp. SA101]|nr:7982_t:CDS:2 [Entrophospora sp. SA101]